MTDILNPKAPTPEEELADEIKAYEEEQAKAAAPEPEPEPEDDGDGEEIEAASDDEDQEPDQDAEAEGSDEAEAESEDEGHKGQRQVPLKALQAEREERARLQREFDEMRGQMSAFMQMFQNQGQQQPQQMEQPAPPPDPEEDPIGAIKWMNDQLKAQQDWRQQQEQTQQQRQQLDQVKQVYARNAQQFAQETPDFNDAYRHLLSSRANELKLQGYNDDQIGQVLEQEELGLAISSLQNGINPAARIYDLAKARGYARKAAEPKQAAPAPRPVVDPEIEERKKAAALNTNRSNPPKSPLKVEDLADLEGAAFDKAWAKMFGPESKRFV